MTKIYLVQEVEFNKAFSSRKKALNYIKKQMEKNIKFSLETLGKVVSYKETKSKWILFFECEDSDFNILLDIYPLL